MTGQGAKNHGAKKKKSLKQWALIAAYGMVLAFYGIIGGLLLGMIFPDFPAALFIVGAAFVGAKLDYKLHGLASRFEQRYVSEMEK